MHQPDKHGFNIELFDDKNRLIRMMWTDGKHQDAIDEAIKMTGLQGEEAVAIERALKTQIRLRRDMRVTFRREE